LTILEQPANCETIRLPVSGDCVPVKYFFILLKCIYRIYIKILKTLEFISVLCQYIIEQQFLCFGGIIMIKTDIVIIGSGIAALSVANTLCKNGRKVTVITKGDKSSSNSTLAQGGIAVALSENDNYTMHYDDTLEAGCYYNNPESVMTLVSKAPDVIREFIKSGMNFDTDEKGNLLFGKEGAHHISRIIHAGGDRTGLKVMEELFSQINENVTINENEMVLELRVKNNECSGVITRDADGNINRYEANYTILATGGIGQLYPCTSNDITITGDGLAMAYRAGLEISVPEFVQFHPTMLNINGKTMGLVSEAVRGDGGILINQDGVKIMEGKHPLKDLAPRDVVSRVVYDRYLKGDQIYLDISNVENFKERFPYVSEICDKNGIDLNKNIIPVRPGAHFHMGGIKAAPNGKTGVNGLYVVGEAACTGVHGANRLASNSLLEGLVFGKLTAENIINSNRQALHFDDKLSDAEIENLPDKKEIQSKMMEFIGIVRYKNKIPEIIKWFEKYIPKGTDKPFGKINFNKINNRQTEIYNMLTAGYLIAVSALKRGESIGAHYIIDKE